MTTTPEQEPLTIETPFGTAVLTDARHYTHNKLARLKFEVLTVNNKEYKDVMFNVTPGLTRDDEVNVDDAYGYGSPLTASAKSKVEQWVRAHLRAELSPLYEDQDPANLRADVKSPIRSRIARKLHELSIDETFPEPLRDELIREVLREALAAREQGHSFSTFYLRMGD